ncbi:MAG TPA: hypothetical protein VFX05_08995 [Casimicrobiaceae bacterium]|nr:hypothetical protein [Casimicrobiaceae bacterium]
MTAMTVERNAQALVALVEDDARQRIEAALGAAREDAARVRREAHASARTAVREAYADERHRHRERVAAAQAASETRRRLAQQALNAALVAAGLAALPAALRQRWNDEPARRAWIDDTFAQARTSLPAAAWQVTHPVAWAGAERDALRARIVDATGIAPAFVAAPAIDVGLAIEARGTRVDATLAGLLADRARLGARLLHFAQGGAVTS